MIRRTSLAILALLAVVVLTTVDVSAAPRQQTSSTGVTVSPTALTVTEEDTTGDSYTVVLDSQPTASVEITVAGHAGTDVTPTPTSLAFTTSDWDTAQTVTVTAGSDADTTNETVTLTHSAASTDSNYQGITIGDVTVTVNDDDIDTTAGICGRTEEVRDGLVALMPGVSDCGAVTAADLAAIIGTLDLSNQSISDLKAGDFNGLTKLETLYLDNNDLTTLRGDVFDGLTSLETLALDNNDLSTLRGDVFDGLTSLETLYLNSNKLTTLPAGVFDGLTSLETLYLNNNDLTSLRGDVFDGLTSLKVLTLYYNDLDTLPAGVFGPLTRLKVLYLSDNPGAAFAPTADALPDAGTVPVEGGTVRLDGSGSGGPWGTNVSYHWELTPPARGVTFNDATSATPVVTIPGLAADTELTFTLTVTGRGGTDGIETASDTARVTATQNITNNPPVFADGTAQARTLAETVGDATVGTAADIGAAVNALGTDGDTLTYFLLGADPDKFTFDTSSGQIRTKVGESYDYEAQSSYSVTVAVTDGTVTVSAAVTLNVTDRNEPPLPLTTPVVTATQGSTPSLNVSWTQPSNPGRPDIDSYDLQYRVRNTGDFIDGPQDETGNSAPIGNLTANTEYEVQVRATNAEGDGVWSPSGTGTTSTTTTTDPAGVTVSETALTVVEENITGDNYTVVLDSLPTANVVITVAGHSGTDVTPTPTTLTFTTSDWDTAQTVTVTAGDDADTTSETVTLTHSAASTDSDYSGITIGNVTVTVSDNDTANTAPIFREGGSTSRAFNETIGDTAVSTASNIGAAVDASDRDTLTYSLEGIDQTKFGIIQTNGQIQTKVGERYSYEAQSSYSVTVRVVDGNSGSDTITVTLNVRDVDEQPARPAKPGVLGTAGTTNSLDVSWTKPDLAGGPEITGYNLHYRVMGQNTWIDETHSGTGTMATITGLNPGTEYEVEVQAKNGETPSAWSPTGNGSTGTTTTIDPGITVSPTALTVTEEDTTGDSYTVVLDSLPTANVVITVAGHAGTDVTPTPTSLAFTTSDWDTAQTVTVTAGSDADTTNETVTLTHSGASTDSNYQGITIGDVTVTVNDDDIDTTAGICGRTEEVRDGLVALMPGVSDCGAVTAADLAAIIGTLDLSNQSISDLKAGDFNGLTKLETLYLDNNDLTTLRGDVFDELTALETLALDNNDLSTLRGDVFDGLTSLETLYLNSNKLTTLPAGVFDGLTSLKVLTLYYNDLDTLPAGVFGPLTRLKVLYLSDNPGAAFAPTADALPDAGTVSTFGGTVQLDGSGSGGPWGTNVSYSWALTTPVSGVTFDDDTSAMPEVTIPVLAADTELTFTLTVTGRGGTDGIETASDTARVTATQNITNNPPVFADGTAQARTLAETVGDATVGTAADIGAAVNALGTDGDTLTYFLLGADPDKFTFDTSSGQIRTKVGESYDYEAQSSYSVTVAVTDGTVTVSAAVTLNVTDRNEPPLPLTTPVVTATQGSTPSLNVSWTQPSNPGRPDIDSYDLQYRVRNTGDFIDGPQDETGNSAPIGNLTANTEYEVQVRATNAEGDGVWSPSGTGTTSTTTTTDPAGVTVSETALTVVEENITGDNYTVVLDSLPTANVVITVAGHSGTDVTPTPTTLTFTTSDWDTAQTVTVTAGDDADTTSETVTLTHSAASTDSDYSGITIGNVTVTVSDNDTANTAPIFREGGSTSRAFNETIGDTAVSTASNIGAAVDASDRDTLTYSLEGIDQTKFGIIQTNGQIQTKVGERYSYEAQSSYSVTVRVVDGNSGSDTITVTLNVRDVDEQPARPAKPGVLGTAGTTNSLDVSWTKPDLAGGPEITGYNLHYRVMGQNTWIDETHSGTGTMATITGLNPGTEYEVEVQAKNGETPSAWSPTGNGSTGTTTTIDPGITVSPTALTVTEEDTTGDSYTVVLDSLPTANVVITVAGHAGTDVTPTPTSLAFTTSDWDTAQTVTVTAGSDADTTNETVTLTHSGASTDSNYQGITIGDVTVTVNDDDIDTTAGICGRTEEVRDGLVALMPGVSDCGAVTAADLAAIIGTLDLSNQSISDLKAGDFNGLTKLETLYLDNNDLTTLRGDVFDELTALETLALDNNDLSTLRGDVFDGLTKLETLYLNSNKLTTLPAGVFDGLTSLETLYLNSNKLTTLPAGVFDGLTSLKVLTLYYNDLDTLPAGVFGPLTRLKVLYLSDNPGAAFAPTADALPDAGTVSTFGGTVQLDGSGSGGPWGTNVSYSWALTTPVSGVTFDDDTSAMPEVTIPVLAADTELTFTLTVTGRGGTDGIETASDTARVTATASTASTASGEATRESLTVNDGTSDLTLARPSRRARSPMRRR